MLRQGRGAVLFTGASASVKGYPQSAPFAMGKFALRGLAQSMARELAPQGIHVAHFVIDGGIRSARRPEPPDNPDSLLDPGRHRRELSARPAAAAQRLGLGNRIAAVGGEVLIAAYIFVCDGFRRRQYQPLVVSGVIPNCGYRSSGNITRDEDDEGEPAGDPGFCRRRLRCSSVREVRPWSAD